MKYDPRLLAAHILSTWTHIHDPPRIESRDSPEWQALVPRDRALAFDLTCGVIRRRLTLDALIHAVSKTPLPQIDPDVMAVLRMGVYQLIIARGIADHAAIDTSVELVRTLGAVRAASFVNAVLRNIQRLSGVVEPLRGPDSHAFPLDSRRQIKFNRPLFPDPQRQAVDNLAVTTSHPRELVSAMIQWLGVETTRQILIADNVPPVVTLRSDEPDFVPPDDTGLIPHQTAHFFVAADGWNPAIEALIARGTLSPQDPTSALPVQALIAAWKHCNPGTPAKNILDLCAGQGTKSIQLARALGETTIIACDIAPNKLAAVSHRASQTGVKTIRTMDIQTLQRQTPEDIDIVLVDAPCSNTGVMGRRLQLRWRWPLFNIPAMRDLQLRLLHDAAKLLCPNGLLVYSTCSIDPGENTEVVQQFMQSQREKSWQVIHQASQLPANDDVQQRCDGGFTAVLRRTGLP
ncbi:MAG: transcription antitermination factor NusB [Phycisphaerae bacterium]